MTYPRLAIVGAILILLFAAGVYGGLAFFHSGTVGEAIREPGKGSAIGTPCEEARIVRACPAVLRDWPDEARPDRVGVL